MDFLREANQLEHGHDRSLSFSYRCHRRADQNGSFESQANPCLLSLVEYCMSRLKKVVLLAPSDQLPWSDNEKASQ